MCQVVSGVMETVECSGDGCEMCLNHCKYGGRKREKIVVVA